MTTFDLGPIRPTSEAASLLMRVTCGCAWNKCKFCNNYRTHAFSLRELDTLKAEVDVMAGLRDRIMVHAKGGGFDMEAVNRDYQSLSDPEERHCYAMVYNWIAAGEYTMFLQDGDAMSLPHGELAELIRYIRLRLPEVTRITSYGRPDTLSRISPEDYLQIKEAGLGRIHAGFESGCDEVLKRVTKGVTSAQQIEGGRRVMASGIELSVFLMAGLGGRALSDVNADQTAHVINQVNPSFVRLRTAVVIEGTPLWKDWKAGVFDECTDMEQLLEMRRFLAGLHGCTGEVFSDHTINLLQELEGPLTDIPALLKVIDDFLALPREDQRRFQLAKRMGFNGTWRQMGLLKPSDAQAIDATCARVPDGPEWEKMMKDRLRMYI